MPSKLILTFCVGAMVLASCATPPAPPIAGDLTQRDIETAMADAMMVTAAVLFRIALDEDFQQPDGAFTTDTANVTWTGMDFEETVGTLRLVLMDHTLSSELFKDDYRDYLFSGEIVMKLNGESADLSADLDVSHDQPDRYPVQRLEMALSELGETIRPEEVRGFIRVNGHEVDVAVVVESLQVGD